MPSILNSLQIVEGSAFIGAPFLGMSLAELGADVIRFDPIDGGPDVQRWPVTSSGRSLYWAGLNKGKRHPASGGPRDRDRAHYSAGSECRSLRDKLPGRGLARLEELRQRRADLIAINIVGNRDGSTAVDYTVNCATGFPLITGPVGSPNPTNHVLPAWDLLTALTAAVGLLAAERRRRETGEGQLVRLALSDVAFAIMGHLGYIADVQINHADRPSVGNHVFGAFGRDFATKDGRRVMVVAISEKQWHAVKRASGRGEAFEALECKMGLDFNRQGDRFAARDAIADLLEEWTTITSYEDITSAFNRHGVCWGPYRTVAQLVREDPRVSPRNPMFQEVDHPGIGRYLTPRSALDFGAALQIEAMPAPRLGAHTDEILADVLHLSAGEIARYHDQRIVAGPDD